MNRRFIVAGYSPRLSEVPEEFYDTGIVIGVNQTYRQINSYLDAWLLWDHHITTTHKEMHDVIEIVRCPKFIRDDEGGNNQHKWGKERGIFWYSDAGRNLLPLIWGPPNLQLKLAGSSITAAANLALILGATEIVLVGIDFIGNQRLKGFTYPGDDLGHLCQLANTFFKDFPIPIYKTVKESMLSLPLMNLGVQWTL
ncbi:MAG TPA: hypothetical protein EYQ21_05075 [Flavobacteriales bacterium]|nr:hypothetical protein [Flavobacteriales bacterium]